MTKPVVLAKKAPIVAKTPEVKEALKPVYKSSSSEDLKKLPKFNQGEKSTKD